MILTIILCKLFNSVPFSCLENVMFCLEKKSVLDADLCVLSSSTMFKAKFVLAKKAK